MTSSSSPAGASPTPASDPRLDPSAERDIRPVIDLPRGGLSGAAIAGVAAVAALGLFGVLEARRQAATAPATTRVPAAEPGYAAPPPLYIPPAPVEAPPPTSIIAAPLRDTPPPAPRAVAATPVAPTPAYGNVVPASPIPSPAPRRVERSVSGQALIVDTSGSPSATDSDAKTDDDGKTTSKRPTLSTTRARAAMFANRSTTVPQGTLIPAVLETAFDSTSPGFARALVQRDIHGFDGTRVLIPRGSRLIGEYGAETTQGQKRAVILWSRLIRPDGVTIAIGSPAADTLGRGGVKADVNSHFLERFSGAILQSALDVGVNLAARSSRSSVIVALPGSTSQVAAAAPTKTTEIAPTLRVPAGRSVSVFVARDLDFTGADGAR